MDNELLRQKYYNSRLKIVNLKSKLVGLGDTYKDLENAAKEALLIDNKVLDEEDFIELNNINNKVIDELSREVIPIINEKL